MSAERRRVIALLLGVGCGLACGGSDAHTVDEVAAVATRFSVSVRTRADLVTALKNGMCRPEIPVSAPPVIAHRHRTGPAVQPAPFAYPL